MNFRRAARSLVLLAVCGAFAGATTVLDFIPLSVDGKPVPLTTYRGKVLLIVNVASHSIFTDQYAALEALYQKYKDQGLVVLAFPSDDFGKEEPDSNDAIRQFVEGKYKVTFPLFGKVALSGEHIAPLFQYLMDKQANATTGGPIRWNFTKFLVDREGKVVARFEPDITPDSPELAVTIEKTLRGEKEQHDGDRASLDLRVAIYQRIQPAKYALRRPLICSNSQPRSQRETFTLSLRRSVV